MKIYKIIIVGLLLIFFGVLLGVSTPGQTVASQIKEVIVANFPALQEVLVVNTEPIDVNVINQSSSQETKIVTFFDNDCGLSGSSVSSVVETDGYSKIAIHPQELSGFEFHTRTSLDGSNWFGHYEDSYGSSMKVFDIAGPYYKVVLRGGSSSGCVTIKGYLIP